MVTETINRILNSDVLNVRLFQRRLLTVIYVGMSFQL